METLLSPVKSVFVNIFQLHCSTEHFMFAPPPSPHRDPIRCISKLYSNSKYSASSHLHVQHCCKVKCIQLSAKGRLPAMTAETTVSVASISRHVQSGDCHPKRRVGICLVQVPDWVSEVHDSCPKLESRRTMGYTRHVCSSRLFFFFLFLCCFALYCIIYTGYSSFRNSTST